MKVIGSFFEFLYRPLIFQIRLVAHPVIIMSDIRVSRGVQSTPRAIAAAYSGRY